MSRTATRHIAADVLAVLEQSRIDAGVLVLPRQLERTLYERTNDVLTALGGKWNRRAKGHVFDSDPELRVATAIATRSYEDPKLLAFFATPPDLALDLVRRADVQRGHLCLEPSAGEGSIALRLALACGDHDNVLCFEIDKRRADTCTAHGLTCQLGDFLTQPLVTMPGVHDRVVMNPPFAVPGKPQADIAHVMRALAWLKPGGKLVSVMSAGTLYRSNREATTFREFVAGIGGELEPLPDGSFAESGTAVRTCVVTMTKGQQ